mmetsp:Transcript_30347/g.87105  ORF Transcript_30347/g.87105 Transcript_30347/m.87105 type:complete len:110 (+) Transcript_30347:2328-2657(+)
MSSACEPFSSTEPDFMTMITPEFLIVERRCATVSTVRPTHVDWSASSVHCTRVSDSLSRAEVASSSRSTWGLLASARAMAMRCFWPPDIWPPPTPTSVSSLLGSLLRKS